MKLGGKILVFCIVFLIANIAFAVQAFLQFPLSEHYNITQYMYDDYTLRNGLPTYVYGDYKHSGTDYDVSKGNPVYAAVGGIVVKSFNNFGDGCSANSGDGGGYGNHIIIEHSNGYYTLYGHMEKGSVIVNLGDKINAGDMIGLVGSSGFSMGSDECGRFEHLHFEVRKTMFGGYVNPYNLDTGCLFLGGCKNPQLPTENSSSSSQDS
ncbi:MAG: M23 family metallopeptidase [Parcubacteria group bacterium]|nr:M23 family metallopeptidase [Parcubacteria group bacterium]